MSSHLKAELAATCSSLGRLHKGEYLIEPDCVESVKDLIRYLKRDDESHEIRRYLGESKVLQNDLVYIIKSCPEENSDLFDVTLRLLINLTTPTMLFYRDEVPAEKIGRNIYLSLIGYGQCYKIAFCDVEFWSKVCGKLTNLIEIDWAERSADDGIQIERILLLLRNVLHIPADEESEKRPENDITVHDKVLWALRQSQILELLLFLSTNTHEEQYFLNLLEIFSLVFREQNAKVLAQCDIHRSGIEKMKDAENLVKVREFEKHNRNKYRNVRNFSATFVMKGVKSLSNKDVVCHKFLDKADVLIPSRLNKKQVRSRKNFIPIESERPERRSAFSIRLFMKEFCVEFLTSSFSGLMNIVKNKIVSGKSLTNDQTYYFWALKFFLEFAVSSNSDVTLIHDLISMETFHFIQISMDDAFEHLLVDKKKTANWVKRIHLILKAYRSLLEALLWMDCSKNALVRSISREIKSQIFVVTEYREMILQILLRYDPAKFSMSYLRDLLETAHLSIKLLEEYAKQTKLVIQKVVKMKTKSKKSKQGKESKEEKWEKIKDDVYDILCGENEFPEMPPFDAALEIPIDDQKGRAMKKIQELLHLGKIKDGIGLLRSARQVWPENECFGSNEMSVEDEVMALQEICIADLCGIDSGKVSPPREEKKGGGEDDYEKEEKEQEKEEEEEEEEKTKNEHSEGQVYVVEKEFDMMDYKKRLVNKKIIEGCGTLLKNYEKNSDHTNHCIIKFLYRIGWECCMPAMLYQASLFWTLLKILQDKSQKYSEINTFTINLLRRFRKHATNHPVVFLDLLFWKECNVALEIQHGYESYPNEQKATKHKKYSKEKKEEARSRNRKHHKIFDSENSEQQPRKTGKRETKNQSITNLSSSDESHIDETTENKDKQTILHKSRASKIIFENISDSGDEQVSLTSKSKSSKPSFVSGDIDGDTHATIRDTNASKKPNEDMEKQRFGGSSKLLDFDEENDTKRAESQKFHNSRKLNDTQKKSRHTSKSRRRIIKSSKKIKASKRQTSKRSKNSPNHVRLVDKNESEKGPEPHLEDSSLRKDIDGNTVFQTTDTSSKKRVQKNKRDSELSEEEIDESNYSKPKRIRYISSDSDNHQSEDDELIPVRRRRWRKSSAVIDSGSDTEPVEEADGHK